jgi:hypothetical protein
MTPGAGPILTIGAKFEQLLRGPTDDITYQNILALSLIPSDKKILLKFFLYTHKENL